MFRRALPFFLLILSVVSLAADAQTGPKGITLNKATLSGGNLTVELTTNPPISSPSTSPGNGQIELKWMKETATGGYTESAPSLCDGPNWLGSGSPASKWTLTLKINQAWTGRLKFTLVYTGPVTFAPVHLEIDVKPKVARAESGSASDPVVLNKVSMIPGDLVTFYIRVREPVNDSLITSENGEYHLQIEGHENGASCFSFEDGQVAKTITFQNGQAEITLIAYPGATWAYLVGFDPARAPSHPAVIGSLRIILEADGGVNSARK